MWASWCGVIFDLAVLRQVFASARYHVLRMSDLLTAKILDFGFRRDCYTILGTKEQTYRRDSNKESATSRAGAPHPRSQTSAYEGGWIGAYRDKSDV